MRNGTIIHLDLFSGIGGFALAAEMAFDSVEHVFCDIEPFAQAVLRKHWPNSLIYGDIRELTADSLYARLERRERSEGEGHSRQRDRDGEDEAPYSRRVDLLTGGFPCQPFSAAGRRLGTEDDRHLWPEMLRVIRETNPRWIVGENVGGFLTWNGGLVFEQVCADLEAEGYEVCPLVIPACAVNAPHRRDRVWIAAHFAGERRGEGRTECQGRERLPASIERGSDARDPQRAGLQERQAEHTPRAQSSLGADRERTNPAWSENWPEVAARLCTLDDGLPNGLARPRGWRNAALKGAGNAIVPQVAAEIMRAMRVLQ